MPDKTKGLDQPFITSSTESEKETECIKELATRTIQCNDISEYHYLLWKHKFRKTLRILARINGFINNSSKDKKSRILITEEIERSRKHLIKQAQRKVEHSKKFKDNQKRVNLHKKVEGIYECKGGIEGAHSVYISSKSFVGQKIIFSAHKSTFHRRIIMITPKVCCQYWIPTLRSLVIFTIRNCLVRKKYQATYYPNPKQWPLRKDRTKHCFRSQVLSSDYVGPVFYRSKFRKDLKAYNLLFSCSVSRTIHLTLVPNLSIS